ncbi:hypothetical protein KKC88_06350 [Patescibacteria group bacterium]|nr:hypothetical protein [Patescibacteria group bacterium]MBU1673897.1 hypothetical protein [Patescibacteria group bacterium]MBU1963430.1 hypothetical protein [Patescibacteria group bacterium]
MKRRYYVLFENEDAREQKELFISRQEAAAIKSLAVLMDNPAFNGDAEGVFAYLCGFVWFRKFHGLKPGEAVRFRTGQSAYHPREENQDDDIIHVWTQEYFLAGNRWMLSLLIKIEDDEDVDVVVQE